MTKELTEEDKLRVLDLEDQFETNEDLADSDRIELGSRLCALMDHYRYKYESYSGIENPESETIREYTDSKVLYEMFKDIHERYIRLDNFRCSSIHKLCSLLSYTDLDQNERIKKYEY